ncbi:MAG: hypothetical protein ACHP65_10440 [Legionellales bacterium]
MQQLPFKAHQEQKIRQTSLPLLSFGGRTKVTTYAPEINSSGPGS